ncbi:MAG: hypothetical protein LBP53_02280 [Candidatus Peribacteria bacterium]|jgi:hypothetical protein|nr:hypothetical protein [Candidatus Peribacteria bacterium]
MVNVLAFEIEELKKRVNQAIDLRKEIEELGKTANEQGDETFGHDNPILEAKHEKERYLSSILP